MDGHKIDIAFVIDATGSMGPIIEWLKANPFFLSDRLKEAMEASGKPVETIRMRVIDFADFAIEGREAIHASKFFEMPQEREQFERRIKNIRYEGRGGDLPENALEALWVAMNSDWVFLPGLSRGFHIIVLITDAYPLNLRERAGFRSYVAEDYPENISDMEAIWNENEDDRISYEQQKGTTKLHPKRKLLCLFAPEGKDKYGHSWEEVMGWAHTIRVAVEPEKGLEGVSLDGIISEIVRWGEF